MSSVPVLLCGKSPMLAQSFMKSLSSDYDGTHVRVLGQGPQLSSPITQR